MTTRRDALLALPLLCGAPSLRGQKPNAIPPKRLGVISLGADSPTPPPQRPLYLALRQRGWILGENLLREPAYADGKPERLAGLAEELVRKRVDVILSLEDAPTVAAARATRTIPIVFTLALFPVELGLVDSYARPGHNVTGQTFFAGVEVAFKRLVFLREIAPNSKRLSYLIPSVAPAWETVTGGRFDLTSTFEAIAKGLGFETRMHVLLAPQDVDAVFGEVTAWNAQAVTAGIGWHLQARQRVADLLLRHRLPSAFLQREMVEAGGLLSYGVGQSESAYANDRLAAYLDQVLRGAAPATLPVEQPKRYELVINAKTAKALALTIPQSLLLRADELIQ